MNTTDNLAILKFKCDMSHIMVVDSDKERSARLESDIKIFCPDVTVCLSGTEALEKHQKGGYDLIYLSDTLSDMRASELIRFIRRYDKEQVFILIVSDKENTHLWEFVQLKALFFLSASYYMNTLISTTEEAIAYVQYKKEKADEELRLKYQLIQHELMLMQHSKYAQMGEMVAMIAHQWRQPLSTITTVVGTLRNRISLDYYQKQPDPYKACEEELMKAFDKIEQSAGFLSHTLDDFRNFYSPNKPPRTIGVADTVQRVCHMILPARPLQDFRCNFDLDDSIQLHTYENELMHVIVNLINNAMDALAERSIANPQIRLSLRQEQGLIVLEVTDNAGGISKENLTKIFDPYFSTKYQKNGTGLGLYMVKTIVESHLKGNIDVKNDSHYGGARFTITLPTSTEEN